ncbi:MAG: hypothetical protein H0U70_05545 [Tatlockia sp.]|nr:hypothetical protein [Tatlockia sp.]
MTNPQQGKEVQSGDQFGLIGYWINRDQTHPIRLIYESDPEALVPIITEKLVFIYFGKTKPSPLEISAIIAENFHHEF